MKAIFETGPLAGLLFEVPGVPPLGLDVEHGGMVMRYAFRRVDGEAALYDFCERRWESTRRRSRPVWLGGELNGVALLFCPSRPENHPQPQVDFRRRQLAELAKMVPCASRPRSSLSAAASPENVTDAQVDGDAF